MNQRRFNVQGSIFTSFSDMVIDSLGMVAWTEILNQVDPESSGIDTSNKRYDDQELMDLVGAYCDKTNTPPADAVRAFGEYLFDCLYQSAPEKVKKINDLIEFLLIVDSVIHVEVKRLYPNAYLPGFNYEQTSNPNELVMIYTSKRKLCHLSEGLIYGAAKQFGCQIRLKHTQCMHDGHENCRLELTVNR